MLVLAMVLAVAGCDGSDEEKNKQVKEDLFSIYEELRPIYTGKTTNEDVRNYLAGVADREGIYNTALPGGGLLLMKQADPHYQNTPSTTIQCSISKENRHKDAQVAAIALTVLTNTENHGQITILFTGEENGEYYGVESLTKDHLKTDNLINLRYSTKAQLITGSACSQEYILRSKAEMTAPEVNKAYEISLISREGSLDSKDKPDYPNPIMTLGLLLSDCRNSGINLQIASFEGSFSPGKYPIYAKAVVVIQSDDEQRLIAKVESSIDKFESKHSEIKPQVDYKYAAVSSPDAVLSHDSTTRLLSLIYTIDDGVPKGEDTEILTSSTVEKINIADNVEVTVLGRSLSAEGQKNFRSTYESIAKLNSYSFSSLTHDTLWESPKENLLADSLSIAAGQHGLKLKSESSLESNECSILTTKKEGLKAISFGVNIQQGLEVSQTLILFLESLHQSKR